MSVLSSIWILTWPKNWLTVNANQHPNLQRSWNIMWFCLPTHIWQQKNEQLYFRLWKSISPIIWEFIIQILKNACINSQNSKSIICAWTYLSNYRYLERNCSRHNDAIQLFADYTRRHGEFLECADTLMSPRSLRTIRRIPMG